MPGSKVVFLPYDSATCAVVRAYWGQMPHAGQAAAVHHVDALRVQGLYVLVNKLCIHRYVTEDARTRSIFKVVQKMLQGTHSMMLYMHGLCLHRLDAATCISKT